MAWQSKNKKDWMEKPNNGFSTNKNTSFANKLKCVWDDLVGKWDDPMFVWNQRGSNNCYNKNNTNWFAK